MRGLIAALSFALLSACTGDKSALQDRVSFWRAQMSEGVPVGSSVGNIQAWGHVHHVAFDYLEQQHLLYANVESVPESGLKFPCSKWNIILKVSINSAGVSTNNEVSTVGTCV